MSPAWARVRSWTVRIGVLALVAGAGWGVYRIHKTQAGASYPNAPAKKGEFLVLVRCRGSVRARRSVGIYTPVVPNLRIAWIAPTGSAIKAGDVILRFDSSTAQQQLMQKQAQLKQSQATLDQAVAQAKITAQQDQRQLADANFTVEQAGYQVKKDELQFGPIKGKESAIDLEIAQQKLKLQEATIALHEASSASRIASLTRQRDQVQTDVDITSARIAQMEMKAPIGGLLLFNMNYSGVFTTADAKPYKVGDNVGSNMLLGSVPDLDSLEMNVKLEEADRGRVAVDQDALIRVDALPESSVPVNVNEVTALAEMSLEYPYTRSFRASARFLRPDPRLRPDMNGGLDVIVRRIPDAVSIPSKALFTRAGKPVVYVNEKGRYRAAEVGIEARNPDEVAITGVREGAAVALVDLAAEERKK
jgi:multidrug efflux pump subunit AcrA (membrane-fusion protein)